MSETMDLSNELLRSVAWAAVRDRRVLAVRTDGRDAFYLPGGKIEPGESPETALCREVLEELGVVLDPLSTRPFAAFTGPAHGIEPGVTLRMLVYWADGRGDPRPAREVAELAWLGSGERGRCAPVARKVLERLFAEGHID
jgi:8-oxo-dGTP pyrophosphatase MutT (NUDIX family)